MQKAASSWCDDLFFGCHLASRREYRVCSTMSFFFWITCVFFEISDVKKAALQSLSYSIFAKTSGPFRTFFGTYAESEKLEGTLPMLIWYVIAMKPLKV